MMSLSYEQWVMGFMAVLSAITLIWTVVWSIHMRREIKSAKNDSRISELHERTTRVESKLAHLPPRVASHEDVERVHNRVSEVKSDLANVKGDLGEIGGTVNGIRSTVEALTRALLKGPKS